MSEVFESYYEAHQDKLIDVRYHDTVVSITANAGANKFSPDPKKLPDANIYLNVDGTYALMTIEEATEVVLALVKQIVYHADYNANHAKETPAK